METDSLYIPLNFWYNTNHGLAIPLIAIQKNKIEKSMDNIRKPYWKLREYNNFTLDESNNETLTNFINNII